MTAALTSPSGVVPGLTQAWVRLYCAGMSEEARAVRQLEIESDIWEHFADRTEEGASPASTNIEMFSRLLRGVPSDIAWRFQAEGFQVNIHFPIERLAGVLLLFLIIPFIAGTAISGYDTGREGWTSEFSRFAEMSSGTREATGILHGAIGAVAIAGAALLFATLQERSRKLISVSAALLVAAGTVMLVNAALYRAMSSVADEWLATGDAALITNARGFALAIEGLSMMNATVTTSGVLGLAVALVRLGMVPRWTFVLPAAGAVGPLLWIGLGSSFPDAAWWSIGLTFMCVALWLLICGIWLLFGGSSRTRSMKGLPAHA